MEHPWEDNLLERKTVGDLKDLLKTMVAFANSVRPGHTAVILIGEKDDGTIQGVKNAERILKTVREQADKIYPAIVARWKPYEANGKWCVRVEIEYSGDTPHFGGISWIRKGSESVKATDEIFQKLIVLRLNKVRELSKWLNMTVTLHADQGTVPPSIMGGPMFYHRWPVFSDVTLVDVNEFWATFKNEEGKIKSEPLEKLMLSFHNEKEQLAVIVNY